MLARAAPRSLSWSPACRRTRLAARSRSPLQQFPAPALIAYLAALAGRIAATDLVLEPSAGTGLLAGFAYRAGARLALNEIDRARAEILAAAFLGVSMTRHGAELIRCASLGDALAIIGV